MSEKRVGCERLVSPNSADVWRMEGKVARSNLDGAKDTEFPIGRKNGMGNMAFAKSSFWVGEKMGMKQKISVVVPCYHSAETLPQVIDEIVATLQKRSEFSHEIILVNDNAPDDTYKAIRAICSRNSQVKGVCMMRNFGQHAALLAGFRESTGEIIVCLDDDGQTPPSEMFHLIDALTEEVDVVYADYPHRAHSLLRKMGSGLNDRMACWLLNKPKGLYLSSFIAAKRKVIQAVMEYEGPYPYVDGLILRSAGKIVNIPVKHRARSIGQSGYSFKKLFGLWMNGFTAFSIKPLRIGVCMGGLLATGGFIGAAVIVAQKIYLGDTVSAGWSSLMCLLLIMGGLILMMLGLVGEYIGRIYLSMNKQPQYIIREICGDS